MRGPLLTLVVACAAACAAHNDSPTPRLRVDTTFTPYPTDCTPALVQLTGGGEELFRCECGGAPVSPKLCGCFPIDTACDCGGEILDSLTCAFPCDWDPYDLDDCVCGGKDGEHAPEEFCQ